eukprot:gnl/TRDRNA2_/TRDRNA2_200655_c0_seq1.p1 gnl/TRDRNA2_/TRDRNA2_200655_c0~~gnl/TRDRNA2_/TRDRNA2_200655_c0_seq1.p1  ORF type:complete len:390 (+),score=39.60 gnl/TRDRNA2_/TRDRNA2_200655_c0_seq1:54-1172(+)
MAMVDNSYPRPTMPEGLGALPGSSGHETYQAVIKNTFVEAVDVQKQQEALKRSKSDSDLSGSSEERMKFWLPSLSSASQNSSLEETSSEHRRSSREREALRNAMDMMAVGGQMGQLSLGSSSSSTAAQRPLGSGPQALMPPRPPLGSWDRVPPERATEHLSPGFGSIWEAQGANGDWRNQQNQPSAGYMQASAGDFRRMGPGPPDPSSRSVPPNRSQANPAAVPGSPAPDVGSLIEQMHRETRLPISDLQALAQQGLLQQIPRNDRGEVSSIGSIKHASNQCSPCLFWFRKSCAKGINCDYCHFRHKGQRNKRIRPSKKTRMQMRNSAPGESVAGEDDDGGSEDDADSGDQQEEPTSPALIPSAFSRTRERL